MAMRSEFRRPWVGDTVAHRLPPIDIGRDNVPQIELEVALGGPSAVVGLVGTELLGELGRRPQRVEVDLLGDPLRQLTGFGAVEGQTLLEEHVLQAHQTETDGTPLAVGVPGFVGRVEVDVDHTIEERHDQTDHFGQAIEVELAGFGVDELAQVHRTEVADGGLVLIRDLDDLGAQVRQVHDVGRAVVAGRAGLVALGVRRVLEGHPSVAGLGQAAHHAAVQVAGLDLTFVQTLGLGFFVGEAELFAVQVGQVRDLLRIEQRPLPVLVDTLHEQVGYPVGEVQVVGAPGMIAGVLLEIEEVLDVGMPALEIDAGRTLCGGRPG